MPALHHAVDHPQFGAVSVALALVAAPGLGQVLVEHARPVDTVYLCVELALRQAASIVRFQIIILIEPLEYFILKQRIREGLPPQAPGVIPPTAPRLEGP